MTAAGGDRVAVIALRDPYELADIVEVTLRTWVPLAAAHAQHRPPPMWFWARPVHKAKVRFPFPKGTHQEP